MFVKHRMNVLAITILFLLSGISLVGQVQKVELDIAGYLCGY